MSLDEMKKALFSKKRGDRQESWEFFANKKGNNSKFVKSKKNRINKLINDAQVTQS